MVFWNPAEELSLFATFSRPLRIHKSWGWVSWPSCRFSNWTGIWCPRLCRICWSGFAGFDSEILRKCRYRWPSRLVGCFGSLQSCESRPDHLPSKTQSPHIISNLHKIMHQNCLQMYKLFFLRKFRTNLHNLIRWCSLILTRTELSFSRKILNNIAWSRSWWVSQDLNAEVLSDYSWDLY